MKNLFLILFLLLTLNISYAAISTTDSNDTRGSSEINTLYKSYLSSASLAVAVEDLIGETTWDHVVVLYGENRYERMSFYASGSLALTISINYSLSGWEIGAVSTETLTNESGDLFFNESNAKGFILTES